MNDEFTDEQKQYLSGFATGSGLTQTFAGAPTFAGTMGLSADQLPGAGVPPPKGATVPAGPEAIHYDAQDRQTAAGKKLCPEEVAKRKRFPLDQWDDVVRHAGEGRPPKGTDVLAFKYHGMFWVAPAQTSFMCRLRFAGGIVTTAQFRGVAKLADDYGGGFADVTTRANLQIREIAPANTVNVVEGLHDLGILNRGSGADNIRNVTGSPTAGIDPQELIDTRPLTRAMHHHILNHREMYGLPRKFNIAFDGGGAISALEDTNDIGFAAVRVGDGRPVPAGVYFRLALGGITGHEDFARDTGVMCAPDECVPVAAAIVRAFSDHGDRTDRKKARLKYVLDRMGFDAFLAECGKHLPDGLAFRRFPLADCEPRPTVDRAGHVGVFPQKQPGLSYVGAVLPVGRLRSPQMRAIADLADRCGSGTIRLTVWQNLLISDVPAGRVDDVKHGLEQAGLSWQATGVRAGLVACTGSAGCKFASADTKRHALEIADYLDARLQLDQPINIHLTGCPHSCAQHFIGDVGLIATKVPVNDDGDTAEAYHVFVGGGYGADRAIGRQVFANVPAPDAPAAVERMLRAYLEGRTSSAETFNEFVRRHDTASLEELFARQGQAVAA